MESNRQYSLKLDSKSLVGTSQTLIAPFGQCCDQVIVDMLIHSRIMLVFRMLGDKVSDP